MLEGFVVSNGNHAEYVNVPCNLSVKLPPVGDQPDDPKLEEITLWQFWAP